MRFLRKSDEPITREDVMGLAQGAPTGIQIGGFARAKCFGGEDFIIFFSDTGGNWGMSGDEWTAAQVAEYANRVMPEAEYRNHIRQY